MEKLDVVFEDNHIIVVNKPQNILSQSDNTQDEDMLSIVKNHIKQKYNKPGNVFVGLVHRLDRPTGGLMVFARNSKSAKRLSEQIASGQFHKQYLAVVENPLKAQQGHLEDYIKKDSKTNMVRLCPQSEMGAKKAVLDYKLLDKAQNLSLLSVVIATGRPHQIRVQLSNIKNPLFGDFKYGAKMGKTDKLALWAHKLEFVHPVSKAIMKFTSLPDQNSEPWNLFKLEKLV
jgi:23S rRNA pseudouridine1911/1915/1917 synthase